MANFNKHRLRVVHLTFFGLCVEFIKLALKIINTPIVPKRGALPMASKKGIITLTLVISRESIKPPVMRWFCVMRFNFFRVKTKLQLQIEEYIEWKSNFSEYAATAHREVLYRFILPLKYKDISEILIGDIQSFYESVLNSTTPFTAVKAMEALRGFMRYFKTKKQHSINPKHITNKGVLHNVPPIAIIEPMIKRKVGRPPNVAFIKKVKSLKDRGGLSLRAISRAENRSPSNVHRAYHFDLSKVFSK